jgi:hypothetical protein
LRRSFIDIQDNAIDLNRLGLRYCVLPGDVRKHEQDNAVDKQRHDYSYSNPRL